MANVNWFSLFPVTIYIFFNLSILIITVCPPCSIFIKLARHKKKFQYAYITFSKLLVDPKECSNLNLVQNRFMHWMMLLVNISKVMIQCIAPLTLSQCPVFKAACSCCTLHWNTLFFCVHLVIVFHPRINLSLFLECSVHLYLFLNPRKNTINHVQFFVIHYLLPTLKIDLDFFFIFYVYIYN